MKKTYGKTTILFASIALIILLCGNSKQNVIEDKYVIGKAGYNAVIGYLANTIGNISEENYEELAESAFLLSHADTIENYYSVSVEFKKTGELTLSYHLNIPSGDNGEYESESETERLFYYIDDNNHLFVYPDTILSAEDFAEKQKEGYLSEFGWFSKDFNTLYVLTDEESDTAPTIPLERF